MLLPDDKVRRISRFLQKLLTPRLWSWEDGLLGFLGFAAFVVPFARIHCRLTQRAMSRLASSSPSERSAVPAAVLYEWTWWLSALVSHSPIFPRPPSVFLASDASD